MSRDVDPGERTHVTPVPERVPEGREAQLERTVPSRERMAFTGRNYAYNLSWDELETMYDVGRFRVLATNDLIRQRYPGRTTELREDLRSLLAQGLVARRTLYVGRQKEKLAVLALTKAGKKMLEKVCPSEAGQALYAGFVKTREMRHDAAIYRMFEAESGRIRAVGGQVRRVVLDYELKRKAYAPLAKARNLPALEYARLQAEIAARNGLPVLKGKIQLPDLRIEYETADGSPARVDLELATHHYHGSHLAAKAAAGFKIYGLDDGAHPRPIVEDREIMAEIFSL